MYLPNLKNIEKEPNSLIDHHVMTTLWYIVFLAITPYLIRYLYGFNSLRFYFPMVDLIANSFSASGGYDSLFKDLYSLSPNNIVSFLSTNFINLIALMGVSWNGILHAFHHKSLWVGVGVTIFMYMITYLAPTQMIPYVISKVQDQIDKYYSVKADVNIFKKTIHLEDYMAGILLIILLVSVELLLVTLYINFVKNL